MMQGRSPELPASIALDLLRVCKETLEQCTADLSDLSWCWCRPPPPESKLFEPKPPTLICALCRMREAVRTADAYLAQRQGNGARN